MNTKIAQPFTLFILLCGLFCILSANVAAQYRGPGTYFIVAKHSGKFLDVRLDNAGSATANHSVIQQFQPNNGDNQKFVIQNSSSVGFVIIKPKSGLTLTNPKCLDIPGLSLDVVGVQQFTCNNGVNQDFVIEIAHPYYRIRNRNSGLYFDIAGLSLENEARLNQFRSNGGDNQLFQLVWIPS